MSQDDRRPLYVVPDFNSTRRGRVVDAFNNESGNCKLFVLVLLFVVVYVMCIR